MNFRELRSVYYFGDHSDWESGSNFFFLEENCRKYGDYEQSAFKSLNAFRKSGVVCDIQLIGDSGLDTENTADEGIQAHKCVLASKSRFFRNIFATHDSSLYTLKIPNISQKILKKAIDFIYEGSCKVTKAEVNYLTAAAATLQIPTLFQECLDYLNVYNVFELWSLAESLQAVDLIKCCADFISKHLGVLLNLEDFYHLPASKVLAILKLCKINLGPNYNLQILRDALQKWMVLNEEKPDQKEKLESFFDFEKLGISIHAKAEECPPVSRTLETNRKITEFPACFSLIAIMGGDECGRCFPKKPVNAFACRGCNVIEIFDTDSLSWVNSCIVGYNVPFHFPTYFLSDGMFYFLANGGRNTASITTLHRFEPVLSRLIEIRHVKLEETGLAKLTASKGRVRAMSDDREEIFCCGSIRVTSVESGKVAFKVNWKKNTAEELPTLPSPRFHHGAVVVNGDLFVIGGCTVAREPLSSVLILRKGQSEWEEGIPMTSARIGPGVAVLGDHIYAVGGSCVEKCLESVERYHIGSNMWEPVSVMNCSRVFAGVVAAGGCLFVFGGQTYVGTGKDLEKRDVLSSCEKYDPCTDSWTSLPDMSRGRCEMVTMIV